MLFIFLLAHLFAGMRYINHDASVFLLGEIASAENVHFFE